MLTLTTFWYQCKAFIKLIKERNSYPFNIYYNGLIIQGKRTLWLNMEQQCRNDAKRFNKIIEIKAGNEINAFFPCGCQLVLKQMSENGYGTIKYYCNAHESLGKRNIREWPQ